jgi:hypothetical protein
MKTKDIEVPLTLTIKVPTDMDIELLYDLLTNDRFVEGLKSSLPTGVTFWNVEINDAITERPLPWIQSVASQRHDKED